MKFQKYIPAVIILLITFLIIDSLFEKGLSPSFFLKVSIEVIEVLFLYWVFKKLEAHSKTHNYTLDRKTVLTLLLSIVCIIGTILLNDRLEHYLNTHMEAFSISLSNINPLIVIGVHFFKVLDTWAYSNEQVKSD